MVPFAKLPLPILLLLAVHALSQAPPEPLEDPAQEQRLEHRQEQGLDSWQRPARTQARMQAPAQAGGEPWTEAFALAQERHPALPPGLLQAISYTLTRVRNVQPDQEPPSCAGLPGYWGPMGLVADGQGWFRNNLTTIAQVVGVPARDLQRDPVQQILAYAEALYRLSPPGLGPDDPLGWEVPMRLLSELPLSPDSTAEFPMDSYFYGVFAVLQDPDFAGRWGFAPYTLDLEAFFGPQRYARVRQPGVQLERMPNRPLLQEESGSPALPNFPAARMGGGCSEFPGALWQEADPSNYSSRASTSISAVTVHTMQGYYAGSISWFQNPSANVSAHYLMRANDGQITQMVCEADKAWHVGSENPYTVGIEHEGFVSDPAWYTPLVYSTSAALARDIAEDRGMNPLRTYAKPGTAGVLTLGGCIRIKGHQHFPAQTHTDPGIHWNWAHYFRLINDGSSPGLYTAASGTLHDPGGAAGAYADDQRVLYRIDPPGSGAVTLNFSAFDLEANWDYLYVHDGPTVFDPLLGSYTGTALPPALTATSGTMTLDFRSDCSTTAPGFTASWTSSSGSTCATPTGTFTGPVGWTSATVNWNPVAGAAQYQVAGRKVGLSGWRYLQTPLTAKWLGIFDEGSSYEWRVRAECPGLGYGGWSSINTFTTNSLRSGLVFSDAHLQLAPNPVEDWLSLTWTVGEGWFELLDATGRVLRREPAAAQARWLLEDVPSGWYLLRAGVDGYWTYQPFVKAEP